MATASSAGSSSSAASSLMACGSVLIPTPISRISPACSKISDLMPRACSISDSVNPPMPAPAIRTVMAGSACSCRRLLSAALLVLIGRREEIDLVLGRERDDLGRRLLGHVVDRPEQIEQAARRRHPEQALHD